MMRLLLTLAMLLVPVAASAQTPSTVGDLYAMPPDTLADALLPAGHPAIAHVQFGPLGPGMEFEGVYFYTVARRFAADFCTQDQLSIHIDRLPNAPESPLPAMPRRLDGPTRDTLYRYAPSGECDGKPRFFTVALGPLEQGLEAVRIVSRAADLARRSTRLPFPATCDDVLPPCSPLIMLAMLDLGTLQQVTIPPASQFDFYGALGKAAARGQGQLFELSFDEGFSWEVTVTMLVQGGTIARLEIMRGHIVY